MTEGLNRVQLLGTLGQDPELKVMQGGQALLKMRLATSESYLDRNNTRQERTEWHSVTLWGKRGEALAKFLKKGDRIFVEGGIRTETYEKNGEKRYSTSINASNVILCGGKRGEQSEAFPQSKSKPAAYGKSGAGASAKHTAPADAGDELDEFSSGSSLDDGDIPFATTHDRQPRHLRRRLLWQKF